MSDTATQLIVKGTFALLLLGSVITWALVLVKARQRWVTSRADRRFLGGLPRPLRLASLTFADGARGSAARVAGAAVQALAEHERGGRPASEAREAVEVALQAQIESERRTSESGLVVLASIGSTAPFVGLFGTVWGIIHALRAIGSSGSASLEVVAGPIGEALVATAIGIAVAVPAVLAYNFFLRRLKVQAAQLTQLAASLLAALSRHDRLSLADAAEVEAPIRLRRPDGAPGKVSAEPREASV
ncbi:MAG TPA: MotA/TolQ/ExbB proton channel family protein [Polyangia bacterium]|nr:MotA/TolQ/ExbB proton channel family protein [Polyangia bacterium]